jgi:DNA-binding NtrC family response regulator
VRELRNVLHRALVRAGGPARFAELALEVDPPAESASEGGSFQERKREVVDRFEREYLGELMAAHAGNIKQASRSSGIERTQLKRLLRKHGLLG